MSISVPLPEHHADSAEHHAQRSAQAPPGGRPAEEDELEDEGQQHIQRAHEGHRARLLDLQGLGEEALAGDAQHGDQHEDPAVVAARRQRPLAQHREHDEALGQADDGVVPHREVVVDALAHLAQHHHGARRPDGP